MISEMKMLVEHLFLEKENGTFLNEGKSQLFSHFGIFFTDGECFIAYQKQQKVSISF